MAQKVQTLLIGMLGSFDYLFNNSLIQLAQFPEAAPDYGTLIVPPSLSAWAERLALRRRSSAVNVTGAETCPAQKSKGSSGAKVSRRSLSDFANVSYRSMPR